MRHHAARESRLMLLGAALAISACGSAPLPTTRPTPAPTSHPVPSPTTTPYPTAPPPPPPTPSLEADLPAPPVVPTMGTLFHQWGQGNELVPARGPGLEVSGSWVASYSWTCPPAAAARAGNTAITIRMADSSGHPVGDPVAVGRGATGASTQTMPPPSDLLVVDVSAADPICMWGIVVYWNDQGAK